ncbi:hypothetical protein EVJ58_g10585 [Rhodofomes roseus]|uniref:HAT C-terminal dimerisation domain-containing protein n=1 Tax=Rhodofomes roseus TaxID=34475 RepID=A0A4Y9XMT8_9APHY|nr:hypothetical protein EVJ58_g10585 [Rhodofomes roseus]
MPSVVDSKEWKEMWEVSNPKYKPVSASTLQDTQIPQEAERVRALQIEFLKTKRNLTITYDGGANRRRESYYTIHVTTPAEPATAADGDDGRRPFLIEAAAGTGFSHTGQWIAKQMLQIIRRIGEGRFSAVSSDSTGNTKMCRRLLSATIPTILDLPDPVHHTNLPIKNICALEFFEDVIANLRRTLTFFAHSDQAVNVLLEVRIEMDIGRGLESIGTTRFGTVTISAVSMRRCLPALREVCTTGRVVVEEVNYLFVRNTPATLTFETQLNQFIDVTLPFVKALTCLESTHSTIADVFIFWCAIGASLKKVLSNPASGIPTSVRGEIRAIFNTRWRELFEEGTTADVHLSAVYLDPDWRDAAVFRDPNPLATAAATASGKVGKSSKSESNRADGAPEPAVTHPVIARRVAARLMVILKGEVTHGSDPLLRTDDPARQADIINRFQLQFRAYARNDYPYNSIPWEDSQSVLQWWTTLRSVRAADILATLAIKLYAVVPNSMADERTASAFTWLNSVSRNRQQLSTMVSQTQIRQYFRARAKARPHADPKPSVKFCEIDSRLRDDTSTMNKSTKRQTSAQFKANGASAEGDGDVDDGSMHPWLDEKPDHCGSAVLFDIERYIDLDRPELLGFLSSDPVDSEQGVELEPSLNTPLRKARGDVSPDNVLNVS